MHLKGDIYIKMNDIFHYLSYPIFGSIYDRTNDEITHFISSSTTHVI